MSNSTVTLRIKRQDGPEQPARWEEFTVPRHAGANVLSVLMQIRENPVTASGQKTTPPVWDAACLEEVCGSCSMVINGRARQACTALIDHYSPNGEPITIEPFTKFPLVRDLVVDRSRMFEALKRVKAWIPIDGTYDLGPGPRMSTKVAEKRYVMSTCMTCGCCLEVCPQVNTHSSFIGAAAINQARLFDAHPTGKLNEQERLEALMEPGGVADCGKAGNCVLACPKEIPLTTSIAEMNREVTWKAVKEFFKSDKDHEEPGTGGAP